MNRNNSIGIRVKKDEFEDIDYSIFSNSQKDSKSYLNAEVIKEIDKIIEKTFKDEE